MPNTHSAKVALRKSERRRIRNRADRSTLRRVIKKFREIAASDDAAAIEPAFRLAVKTLDKAAAKKLIHRNSAARTKSRLAKLVPRRTAAAS